MGASLRSGKKPVLKLEGVSKNFGGVVAASDINVELYAREVFGLIGPNGAGKTTLVNLITGIYQADRGKVLLNGRDITKLPTYMRARLGIARSFQHPRLLNRCDIYTNIYMGADLASRRTKNSNADNDMAMLLKAAALEKVDLSGSISKLSYGQQKLLELVRAILSDPYVLLLDEPAAGLNSREMDYVAALIRIAVEKDIAVLLIEHAMDFVMSICDWITVLNFGHQIAEDTPEEIQVNQTVIDSYLGGNVHA